MAAMQLASIYLHQQGPKQCFLFCSFVLCFVPQPSVLGLLDFLSGCPSTPSLTHSLPPTLMRPPATAKSNTERPRTTGDREQQATTSDREIKHQATANDKRSRTASDSEIYVLFCDYGFVNACFVTSRPPHMANRDLRRHAFGSPATFIDSYKRLRRGGLGIARS